MAGLDQVRPGYDNENGCGTKIVRTTAGGPAAGGGAPPRLTQITCTSSQNPKRGKLVSWPAAERTTGGARVASTVEHHIVEPDAMWTARSDPLGLSSVRSMRTADAGKYW